jgi:hypothetical protein
MGGGSRSGLMIQMKAFIVFQFRRWISQMCTAFQGAASNPLMPFQHVHQFLGVDSWAGAWSLCKRPGGSPLGVTVILYIA